MNKDNRVHMLQEAGGRYPHFIQESSLQWTPSYIAINLDSWEKFPMMH